MSHSAEFVNHFARLTSHLVRQTDEKEEQSKELNAAVAQADGLPVLVIRDGDTLLADGTPMSKSTIYTMVLVDRMKQHRIVRLEVTPGPSAADVLSFARLLAAQPDESQNLQQRLASMHATSVRVSVGPRTMTTPPSVPATPEPVPTASSSPAEEAPRVSLDTFELVSEAQMRSSVVRPAMPAQVQTPSGSPAFGMFSQFSGPGAVATPAQLLKVLESAKDVPGVENALLTIEQHMDAALRGNRADDAVAIAQGVARHEVRTTQADLKKLMVHSIKRMLTPPLVTVIAARLATAGDRLADSVAVLTHGGDPVVETLAERLAESQQAKERRAIFSTLVQLKSGVPMFIHMLGDHRWFVVRNAADLLAQMTTPQAEPALLKAMEHEDARVRRSVITALARFSTPRTQAAVRHALQDPAPEVRVAAANGLGRLKTTEAVKMLTDLLAAEQDTEVQEALLGALGRQATEDAVKKLVEAAEPSMFARKTPEYRVAAVRALREAGTASAMKAIKSLVGDRDAAVRDAATRASK